MEKLKHLPDDECLMDVDEQAWEILLEKRGGCSCSMCAPCFNCSEPISEEELNDVGYTYEKERLTVMTKRESLEILLLLSSIEAWSLNTTPLLPDYLHEELSEKKEQLTNFILSEEQK